MALPVPHIMGLLNGAEAALYLRVSQRMLRNYVRSGLRYVQNGNGHKRYRVGDLDAWVAGRVRQESSETPSTGTRGATRSRSGASATVDPQVAQIMSELRPSPTVSTPTRSKADRRKPTRAVVITLRGR